MASKNIVISVICARPEDWEEVLRGPLHAQEHRFYSPEDVLPELKDEVGLPLLYALPGSDLVGNTWSLHIYPPHGVKRQ